jgi:GTPase SAR1 family protein
MIKKLNMAWEDEAFKESYKYKTRINLVDTSDYFLKKLENINLNYKPLLEDLLFIRRKTIGVNILKFEKNEIKYKLYDIGGQKSERRVWDQVAKDSDIIIYISSLNDYHKKMYEDNKTNRLVDSINTFKSLISNQTYNTCKIVLIFSKFDLFIEDLKSIKFSDYFDYDGENSEMEIYEYIKNLFHHYDVSKRIIFTTKINFTEKDSFQNSLEEIFKNITL